MSQSALPDPLTVWLHASRASSEQVDADSLAASLIALWRNQEEMVDHPRYRLIFDPQTAGGLLASVPADKVQACIDELKAAGYPHTSIIGRVVKQGDALEPILLKA